MPTLSDELNQQIDLAINHLDAAFQDLFAALNRVQIPIPLLPAVQALCNELSKKVSEFWDWLQPYLAERGSPSALRDTAKDWETKVASAVSAKVMIAEASSLEVDDYWQGSAAEKYKQALLPQRSALAAIKSSQVDPISGELNDIARALTIFLGTIIAAIASLTVAVVIAIVTVETVIGTILSVIAGIVAAMTEVGAGALNLHTEAQDSIAKLLQACSENTAYPESKWPKATVQ